MLPPGGIYTTTGSQPPVRRPVPIRGPVPIRVRVFAGPQNIFFPQLMRSNSITFGFSKNTAKKSIGCLVRLSYWPSHLETATNFLTNFDFVRQYVHKLTVLFELIEVLF